MAQEPVGTSPVDHTTMIPFRVYSDQTVLEAAKMRLEFLFNEFPHIVVTTSGGKDSVVNFHLALEVARKLKRLPLNVMFLDQEIEWEASIEVIRAKMEHPEVKPYWMQIPFKLSNSTSASENWLYCWDEAKRDVWMRPQESYSYKHSIAGMASLVFSMLDEGQTDEEVCHHLGMEADELLRLKHITGFSKLFENVEYRKSWETSKQLRIRQEWEKSEAGRADAAARADQALPQQPA